MKKVFICIALAVVCTATSIAQSHIIGSKDYGLASSSVMWIPRGGALFSNPAELGRIHQQEFLFTTNRLKNLASMIGTIGVPFAGSFAAAVSNQDSLTQYTLGYGNLFWDHHTFGTSISILTPIEDAFRFSFGTAFHFPSSIQNSGIHAGIALSNLPKGTLIDGGIAWWVVPDWFRLQVAAQNRTHRAMVYGGEFLASNNISFLAGSRAFKSLYGGMSYRASNFTTDVTAGPDGISFSLNITIGESAESQRSIAYEEGYNLFSEKRYSEAKQKFSAALEYDEYDEDSRTMVSQMQFMTDSVEAVSFQQAAAYEESLDYPSAINTYVTIARANPSNSEAEARAADARKKLIDYVEQLIAAGDSLKSRKDVKGARKNYESALKYDPQNEIASARIDELENLSKENVKTILARAQSYLSKRQFENAQKEYERVLTLEPKNSQAKAGINTIKQQKKNEQYDAAKTALVEGRYFEALKMLLELSKQNIKYKDLASYIEIARAKLQPQVERQFKSGLTHYAKENYGEAVKIWDEALLIQPRHAGILEYRKRAEEKIKALEQLK